MATADSKPISGEPTRLRVLIVEDTPTVAAMLQAGLRQAGMDAALAQTGAEAIRLTADFSPDIVLLDLGLPDIDGFDLINRFAGDGRRGLIVVTENGAEGARIAGLDKGADDYIVKPVRVRELAARIRALRRRIAGKVEQSPGSVMIDRTRRCLIGTQFEPTLLTEAELAALEVLLDAAGASVSRERLSREALKRPLHDDDRAVDQLVLKLRRKLTGQGASGRTILAVRREGYVIADATLFRMAPPAGDPDEPISALDGIQN